MSIVDFIKNLHYKLPSWSGKFYMPIINLARQLRPIILVIYILEGRERTSGSILKISYLGYDIKLRNYWCNRLFEGDPIITKLNKIPIWKVNKYIERNKDRADLVITEITRLTRFYFSSDKGFVLPRWFNTLINVDETLRAISKNNTISQIKKFGFTFNERISESDLEYFYNRMFKPYILRRHKDASVMSDFSYFAKKFKKRHSSLFFLLKDNKPIAGTFNERKNGMIKFSGIGVLDGNEELLKMGVIRALDFFSLKYYKEKNIKYIDFGGTSPLLSDGLTIFKISMHAFPNMKKLFGEKSLWFIPLNETKVIGEVLKSNPFVFIKNKCIYRAIFLDESDIKNKSQFLKILKQSRFNKLSGTKIFCLNGTQRISQWLTDEALTDHEILDFSKKVNKAY